MDNYYKKLQNLQKEFKEISTKTIKNMKTPKNQQEAILFHLLEKNSITALEATKRQFGYCTRLSARIFDLKELGIVFNRKQITKKSIFGETCNFIEFSIDFKKTDKKVINNLTKK